MGELNQENEISRDMPASERTSTLHLHLPLCHSDDGDSGNEKRAFLSLNVLLLGAIMTTLSKRAFFSKEVDKRLLRQRRQDKTRQPELITATHIGVIIRNRYRHE